MADGPHAVLIGNSTFPSEPRLMRLNCPENDVAGMKECLTSPTNGIFDAGNVIELINARHYEILQEIERSVRKSAKSDLLLLYYSGHGQCDEAGRLHLAAADTNLDTLGSTSVSLTSIKAHLDVAKTNRIVLVLDCCYSGAAAEAFMKGGINEELQRASREGQGLYILTASTSVQTAQEKIGDRYSLLTKHLVDGLSGPEADLDEDGFVSMDELFNHVEKYVRFETGGQKPEKHALKVHGNLIIARSGKTPREERRKQIRSLLLKMTADGQISDTLLAQAQKANSQAGKELSPELQRQVELLDQLLDRKIESGLFVEKWYNVGASPALPLARASTQVSTEDFAATAFTLELRRTLPRQAGGVLAGAISPRGWTLATGSGDGWMYVWDTQTGEQRAKARTSAKPLWALDFSPDGSHIATGGGDGIVRIWTRQGELKATLDRRQDPIFTLAYSADGEKIITGGAGDSMVVHEPASNSFQAVATGHGWIHRVGVAGRHIVSAGKDGAVRVWDLDTGELVRALEAHHDPVYSLAVSGNGQLLVSGGRDGTVRLWETSSWVREAVLRGHKHSVLSLAVHPNGRTIASGSADGTIKFWDTVGQSMTGSVQSGHISANFVLFSPNGDLLVSGGTDQTVRFWDLRRTRPRAMGA